MAEIIVIDAGAPAGEYGAEFLGIDRKDHKFGERFHWQFGIASGEHVDKTTTAFSGTAATLRSNCGKFLAMLVGKEPADGLKVDPDEFIGEMYRVKVAEGEDGGSTRVVSFTPAPDLPKPAVEKDGDDDSAAVSG